MFLPGASKRSRRKFTPSPAEQKELNELLGENQANRCICPLKSPMGTPYSLSRRKRDPCWRSTVHSGLLRLYGRFLIHSLLFAFYSVVGGHNQHMSVPFVFPSVLILETEVRVYFTFTPLISFYSFSKCT